MNDLPRKNERTLNLSGGLDLVVGFSAMFASERVDDDFTEVGYSGEHHSGYALLERPSECHG